MKSEDYRLTIAPDSELALLLKQAEADGEALVVDTGEAVYHLRVRPDAEDPRMRRALEKLKGMITARFPQASFEVSDGEDPHGVYLHITVDIEDLDEVLDVVVERLVDMQVEEGLPIHVIPERPIERVIAELRAQRKLPKRTK